jgi:hypothetical protein
MGRKITSRVRLPAATYSPHVEEVMRLMGKKGELTIEAGEDELVFDLRVNPILFYEQKPKEGKFIFGTKTHIVELTLIP